MNSEISAGTTGMVYHTSLPKLIIPEYGRNVQRMIDYAVSLEDREERNKCARAIIEVMGQLNPHLRDIADFKHKLWDHLFVIADFKLDVDSPYPIPSRETFQTKPEKVQYPGNAIRFRHYGKIAEDMIKKAIEMEEGEMKEAYIETIANMMKRFYSLWNRDAVGDEVIWEQIKILSSGKIIPKDNLKLQAVAETPVRAGFSGQTANNRRKKGGRNQNNRRRY